jgi:hypothetical protein
MVLLSNATTVNYTQVGQIGFGIGGDMPSFSIQSQTVNRDNGAGPYYDYGAQSDLRFLYKTYNTGPAGGVAEAMRIKGTNGYVGIGTASPGSALHTAISSATATTIAIFENYNTTTTTSKSFKLQFYGNGAGGQKDLGGINIIPTDGNFGYNDMAFSIRGPFGSGSAEQVSEVMRFSRAGTAPVVGIGTQSPGYFLEISNSTASTSTSFLGLTNPYAFGFNTGVNIGSSIVYSSRWQGDGLSGIVELCKIDGRREQNANYGDSYLAFQTRYTTDRGNGGPGTLTEKMRITATGNVGIGTNNPSANLSIYQSFNDSGTSVATIYDAVSFDSPQNANSKVVLCYGSTQSAGGGSSGGGVFAIKTRPQSVGGATAPIERLRITDGGLVGIGTAGPVLPFHVYSSAAPQCAVTNSVYSTTAYWKYGMDTGGAFLIYNSSTGSGPYITFASPTAWNFNSDARLKNIIEPISNALAKVDLLNPVLYSWKNDETNRPHPGLIAQDVLKVQPECVSTNGDGMYGVGYTELIPLAFAAIKELSAENTALEQSLATATANVSSLKTQLASLEARLALLEQSQATAVAN